MLISFIPQRKSAASRENFFFLFRGINEEVGGIPAVSQRINPSLLRTSKTQNELTLRNNPKYSDTVEKEGWGTFLDQISKEVKCERSNF